MSRSHFTILRSILPVTTGLELILLHCLDDKKLLAYLVKTKSKFTLQNYMKFIACMSLNNDCTRKVTQRQPAVVKVCGGVFKIHYVIQSYAQVYRRLLSCIILTVCGDSDVVWAIKVGSRTVKHN
jgi:hypothetical protein